MDGIMERWIRDACDIYVDALCELTSLTPAEAKVRFTQESWNTNTLRKPGSVALFASQVINEKEFDN